MSRHGCQRWERHWRAALWLLAAGLATPVAAQAQAPAPPPTIGAPAAPTPAPTPAPEVNPIGFQVNVLTSEPLQIGRPILLQLTWSDRAFRPEQVVGVTFEPPPPAEAWEVATAWRRDLAGGVPAWKATLRPFELGRLQIPPVTVAWRGPGGTTQTLLASLNPAVEVQSIRPPGARDTELVPLRDPHAVGRDWTWLWWLAAGLAAAALLGWWAWRKIRRRGTVVAPVEPEAPPGLWALRELDRRSRLPVCMTGPAKVIFTLVSEVIRVYLQRRYGFAAIDMTTMECLRALQQQPVGGEVVRLTRDFLEECDTVKFTKMEPPRERWQTIWHDARLIVRLTTSADELGEAPDPLAAAAREAHG